MSDAQPAFVFPDPDAPRHFWWPIVVLVPADGAQKEQHFEVQFEELTHEQIEAAAELAAPRGSDAHAVRGIFEEVAVIQRVVKDWRGVVNAGGTAIPFGASHLETLSQISYVRRALFEAYLDVISGRRFERKN